MDIELYEIDSIQELDFKDVYDVSIDTGPDFFQSEHNYIANNVIVHNSHAAGMVVSNVPLDEIAPLRTAKKGVLATQFPNEDLELLGLIKFDILAIATLSVIKKTAERVKENYDIDLDIENLPLDDDPTLELYRRGNLGGVFQCERYGMQRTMRDIGVDRFDDVVAGLALYRPGPMDSIPEYCARKRGEKSVSYFHKSIEPYVKPYLEKTYGVLCIHEDTLISMADGSHKPIKDVRKSDMVLSYPDSTFVEEKECHGCAPTRRCDGYKVTLSNGRSVTLTDDHKVYTWEGMKEVKDLDLDLDLVGCPSVLCRGIDTDKYNCFSWLGMDEDVSYLIGMLIGDGNIHKGVNICVGDEEKSEILEKWINNRLPKLKTHRYFHTRSWYISISCDELVEDWKEVNCGNRKTKFGKLIDDLDLRKNCYNKRIPPIIFKMTEESQRALLAGLIDSDGYIGYGKDNRLYVNYTSVNKDLLEDVRHLCDWLAIETRLKDNKIYFQNGRRVKDDIAPYMVLKNIKKDAKVLWKCKTVFYKKSYVEEKRKLEDLSVRAFCKKYKINRSNYNKRDVISVSALCNGSFINDYGFHKSHLFFYKIRSIEKIKDAQFYGMSVADNHNLFGNGILISNCYQEQVMQICNALANFTITDGYIMIKAIGKKKEFLMAKFEKQFISGCVENGVPNGVAQQYWDKFIKPFSSYGFNQAHSACYGYNSYITAYLKANYPNEFICSLMDVTLNSHVADKYDKIAAFEKEFTKKMNVKFLPRSINNSKEFYTIEKVGDPKEGVVTEIRPSLHCKGIGSNVVKNIVENQPFKPDMRDFVEKIDLSIVDTRAVEALATEGFWGTKVSKQPKKVVEQFINAREDMRKAAKKGVESADIFG